MVSLMFPIIIAIFICLLLLSNYTKHSIKLYLIIIIDILLILSILFKHYLDNILWIFSYLIIIIFIALNIISTFIMLIKYYKKEYFINFIITIISIILLFSNLDNKIALMIELPRAKYKLNNIIKDENYKSKYKFFEIDNGIYAFVYFSGILDSWIAIVYDNSGSLENVFKNFDNNDKYNGLENYQELKQYFETYLKLIKKLEENWYLCYFG